MQSTGLALTERETAARRVRARRQARRRATRHRVREFALAVYDDLAAVETAWRDFQQHADCTAFQTFEWLSTWQRHIGARDGVTPCIVVARDRNDAMLLILPLAVRRPALRASSFGSAPSSATTTRRCWRPIAPRVSTPPSSTACGTSALALRAEAIRACAST